ncbi:MAG TPA: NAD-dependent malic enzyme [Gammaproteobacteria bacterium]|nr:NAD-dependent malic enzyme [Gammaproteobacteria bacterium]
MEQYKLYKGDDGRTKLDVPYRSYELIRRPLHNKGTGFTPDDRRSFALEGLLPSQYNPIELQARRIYASIRAKANDLEKYVSLMALQDRNEHLFYRLLSDHLEELMPIVYTPTVGEATRNFSQVFRRGRGIWITPDFRGRIAEVLEAAAPFEGVRLIVATDNESILGIGDQGAGGMAISIGKLALYTAGAGIHPAQTLPVSLDVGTNNAALLTDDLYLGWRAPRLKGSDYRTLIGEFVEAVAKVFPGALLQWEDFRKDTALHILDTYRDRLPSFNDDIQGTGAVAAAGIVSASRVSGLPLSSQRVLVFGAGAAGLGIARQVRALLADAGVDPAGRELAVGVLDSRGLLVNDRDLSDHYKQELAWTAETARRAGLEAGPRDLATVVERYKPTVLIGSSGQAGAFTEAIVREMASHVARPVILPFSNPTAYAEAIPRDLYEWTGGRCLVACGSPFPRVEYGERRYLVGQGNNVFIFPGLGLGSLLSGAKQVSDGMISAAARALADAVLDEELEQGLLYPSIRRLRAVTRQVAAAVMQRARDEGIGENVSDDDIERRIAEAMWESAYPDLVPV